MRDRSRLVSTAMWVVVGTSIAGNFLAAALARWLRYRRAIAILCLAYFVVDVRDLQRAASTTRLWYGFAAIGICQGVFALFTMYLPPLFPTLLRTTGAGFCYNFGRIAAGLGTVFFGCLRWWATTRLALLCAGFLFLPAAAIALLMPEPSDEELTPNE